MFTSLIIISITIRDTLQINQYTVHIIKSYNDRCGFRVNMLLRIINIQSRNNALLL